MEKSMEAHQKIKIDLPCDSAIPLLGIYPKKAKMLTQNDMCIPMFTAPLFTIAKIWKQPKCPKINKWIKKLWYGAGLVAQWLSAHVPHLGSLRFAS
uniref:Uncharacterized protein n=1 Tax=Equus caballus TaxID=9796 RepID=A0A9L0TFF7_HORSE